MLDDTNTPGPDPINRERVTVPARTLADGSVVFAVPSPFPPQSQLVFAHAPKEDHQRIADIVLTIPRSEIEAYAAFLARHGAIDREPTESELTVTMQMVGNALVKAQMDAMSAVSDFLIDRLGSGDRAAAASAATDSIADLITTEGIKSGAIPPDEAEDAADQIADAIRKWAERMTKETDSDSEGGAK